MAGFLIENVSKGLLKQYFWDEIDALPRDGSVTLLDTRTAEEYNRGHVDGFRNIPLDELREHLADLPAQKPVYVICQSGLRSYLACRILTQNGFDCYNFSGGYRLYETVRRRQMRGCRSLSLRNGQARQRSVNVFPILRKAFPAVPDL